MGFEALTSSNDTTFLEQALPEAPAPGRNTGIQLSGTVWEERATWALGCFAETDQVADNADEDGWSVTGSLTRVPWETNGGSTFVHLGLSGSLRSPDSVGYSQRLEAHLAPTLLQAGTIASDTVGLTGLEAALVHGPPSVQGELISSCIDPVSSSRSHLLGGYLQTSYFLTGEQRPYRRSAGSFGRIEPTADVGSGGDWGAWEVALRWSHLNLSDGDIRGGRLDDVTVGVNWYLNRNVRVMWNYVHAMLDAQSVDHGDIDLLPMRVQVAF